MRIPAEPELMVELNVSRNTLREAIRVHAGLLKTKQGDGTYVCSLSILRVVLHKRIMRSDTMHTMEVWHELEREGAHLAAQRRTNDEARELLLQLERWEGAAARGDLDSIVTGRIACLPGQHRAVRRSGEVCGVRHWHGWFMGMQSLIPSTIATACW
ncbi:FadR/GntR family transcriptional regulator [Paenibacillus vandeheii]